MISDLEVEVNELRVSIDLLTKAMGMQAKAIAALTDVLRKGGSLAPSPTTTSPAPLEESKEDVKPATAGEVRSLFTKLGKHSTVRPKLLDLLSEYSAKKVDEVPTEKLGEVMARAEEFKE